MTSSLSRIAAPPHDDHDELFISGVVGKLALVVLFACWAERSAASATLCIYVNQHTHPFNGPFSGTTRVSRYQKSKTNLDFTEARDREWQWHQLGHMQVCTSLQITMPAHHHSVFTGRMPFLPPNQQRQSTEGLRKSIQYNTIQNLESAMLPWLQMRWRTGQLRSIDGGEQMCFKSRFK